MEASVKETMSNMRVIILAILLTMLAKSEQVPIIRWYPDLWKPNFFRTQGININISPTRRTIDKIGDSMATTITVNQLADKYTNTSEEDDIYKLIRYVTLVRALDASNTDVATLLPELRGFETLADRQALTQQIKVLEDTAKIVLDDEKMKAEIEALLDINSSVGNNDGGMKLSQDEEDESVQANEAGKAQEGSRLKYIFHTTLGGTPQVADDATAKDENASEFPEFSTTPQTFSSAASKKTTTQQQYIHWM